MIKIKINNGAQVWAELCTTGLGVDGNGDEVSRMTPLGLLAASHGCKTYFSAIHGAANPYLKTISPESAHARAILKNRKDVTDFLRAMIKAIESGT